MDERLYKEGVLEPITVKEGVIGYNKGNFGNVYMRYLLTHVICKDVNDALKKTYIKQVNYCSTFAYDLTTRGFDCCIKYLEKKGYEPHIKARIYKEETDKLNEIERNEYGFAEDDLSAKEWFDIAEAEREFEEENKEELETLRARIEKVEKIIEEERKAEDRKRFQDLL
jgi:hypothetical protein